MDSMLKVAAFYSDRILDNRTSADVLAHMRREVDELEGEIELGQDNAGPDGIFGEAIDIIACAVDIIRRELEALCASYMRDKCEKWLRNVEARKYDHQP